MNPRYGQVAKRAAHQCEYCQAPEALFNFPFEVEHIIPPGRGGTNDELNLALSCRSCNLHKSAYLDAVDPVTGNKAPLFNPRLDRWADHFAVNLRSGTLNGLTAIGRATIDRLRINGIAQICARKRWIAINLFPKEG